MLSTVAKERAESCGQSQSTFSFHYGREDGRKGGRKEGRKEGREDGRKRGRKEGRMGGREEGRKGGREEGRRGEESANGEVGLARSSYPQRLCLPAGDLCS